MSRIEYIVNRAIQRSRDDRISLGRVVGKSESIKVWQKSIMKDTCDIPVYWGSQK